MRALLLGLWLSAMIAETSFAEGPLRITGGSNAQKGEYPSTVAFRIRLEGDVSNPIYAKWSQHAGKPFCTGSIVDDYWILTAKHCFDKISLDIIYASTGADLSEGYSVEVDRIEERGDFIDVALVHTKTKITSDKFPPIELYPIRLPTRDNQIVVVAGWGYFEMTSNALPDRLQKKEMWTEGSDTECKGKTATEFCIPVSVVRGQLYWGPQRGDSGGPVMRVVPSPPRLLGVFTRIPDEPGTPPYVYGVSTYYFADWMDRVIGRK